MKHWYHWLAAVMLFALAAGGGCTGSSGGGDRVAMEMSGLTTNEEGVPHVFALPDGAEQVIISLDSGSVKQADAGKITEMTKRSDDVGEHDWGVFSDPAQIKSVLLPMKTVSEDAERQGDDPSTERVHDADTFRFTLSSGVLYTVELSRNLIHGTDGFIPSLTIRESNKLYDPGDGEEFRAPENEPDDDEPASIAGEKAGYVTDYAFAAEPKGGAPAVMLWTFRPKTSGVYAIRISNAKHQFEIGRSTEYMLRVYKEQGAQGNYGHPVALTIKGQDLTLTEVLSLRDALTSGAGQSGSGLGAGERPAKLETNSFGLPIVPQEHRTSAASAHAMNQAGGSGGRDPLTRYETRMEDMQKLKAATGDQSSLTPIISGAKAFEGNPMKLGEGYLAVTGVLGKYVSAVEEITDYEMPDIESPEEDFSYHFISSKQDQINETSVTVSGSFSAVVATVKTSTTTSKRVEYSSTSTTLLVRFSYHNGRWAAPKGGLGVFKLKDEASAYLRSNGPDWFREYYGDYLVTGYRMGAQLDAYITIHADSSSQIDEIKSTLGVKGGKWETDTEFKNKVTKALESVDTDISIEQCGSVLDGSLPDLPTTVEELMDYVNAFAAAARKGKASFQYAVLDAELRSYASMFTSEPFPTMLNVPEDHFIKLNSFCDDIMELNAQYNALSRIEDDNLANGAGGRQQKEWKDKFDDMKNSIEAGMDRICSSPKDLADKHAELKDLIDEFTTLNERWAFYRHLMLAQAENIIAHKDQGFGTWGFKTFNSASVMADFKAPVTESKKKGAKVGHRNWSPTGSCSGEHGVWVYLRTVRYSKGGYVDQESLPTIGRSRYDFHFKSAYDRSGNWEYELVEFDLDPEKYPFAGLK